MKLTRTVTAAVCMLAILASPAFAGNKTCCQTAAAAGKECRHKCCLAAHKDNKSCEKCNPNKEDLKLIKKEKSNKGSSDPKNAAS